MKRDNLRIEKYTVGTTPVKVADKNPRRFRLWIESSDDCLMGVDQGVEAETAYMTWFLWVEKYKGELWCKTGVAAGTDVDVYIYEESYREGEKETLWLTEAGPAPP